VRTDGVRQTARQGRESVVSAWRPEDGR